MTMDMMMIPPAEAAETAETSRLPPPTTTSTTTAIHYFGYGPIVNPKVRNRRRLKTCDERPAILPDFRLTFAYGGIANMIRQRGYEVHGILMKFTSEDDWKHFQKYDAGYNDSDLVQVIPYDAEEGDEPITAYAMSMNDEYDASKLEAPIEQLPTERYLKLIANGMRAYHLDEDYIQDQILSVPYVPSRKPEDYRSIPQASEQLPKISFAKYQRLCQRSKEIYFIINNKVCLLGPHDPEHPAVLWVRERLHGKTDATLIIHETIVEPNLPIVDTVEELTPLHHAWAENHSMEYFRKCNLTATKVYDLLPGNSEGGGMMVGGVPKIGGALLRFCSRLAAGKRQGASSNGGSSGSGNGNGTSNQQPHEGDELRPPMRSTASRRRRRRSTHLRGHDETFVSSELLQQEIARNAGEGGDTDNDEESVSQ